MAKIEVIMPQMGESIQEGTLTKWRKNVGEHVAREETLFEISTDKVDSEIPSPAAGVLIEILYKEGDVIQVNKPVAYLDTEGTVSKTVSSTSVASKKEDKILDVKQSRDDGHIVASPLARKVAQEHQVDLSTVTPSSNRIVRDDVMAVVNGVSPSLLASAAQKTSSPIKTASNAFVESAGGSALGLYDGVRAERVPMSAMRRKIADHMLLSKKTSPHVTSVIEVDLQKIVDLREKFKDKFAEKHGFKLSFMPFFLQAVVEAIKAVPVINASVDGDAIIYKKDINLGCAVALDWGLIVPVIKKASEKSFVGIARDLDSLANKARSKKLAPDDVRGGTFSISNFGVFGTLIGQPIINQPQAAIFGMGAMQKKPVVINDAIAIRTMCYCVLTFDHRIIDGSDSGRFLSTVKSVLENWVLPVI